MKAVEEGSNGRPAASEVVVSLFVMTIIGFGLGSQLPELGLGPVGTGLLLTGWSGIAGLGAFAAAWLVHRRPLSVFGVRSTSSRWLLVGAGAGILALLMKGLAVVAFTALTGIGHSPQDVYAAGGGGGAVSLGAATLLLGVLTPVGEEFLFRGVVTGYLLRFGPVAGVVGGALIFALPHGVNIVLPAALVEGLIAGEVFRRSGSLWPAVLVHVACNLPTIPALVLLAPA